GRARARARAPRDASAWSTAGDAEQVTDAVGHAARDGAERQHAQARPERVASGEERQRRADDEERHGGDGDGQRERLRRGPREEPRRERNQRPEPERDERARRRAERGAELAGIEPELLACERVERMLR